MMNTAVVDIEQGLGEQTRAATTGGPAVQREASSNSQQDKTKYLERFWKVVKDERIELEEDDIRPKPTGLEQIISLKRGICVTQCQDLDTVCKLGTSFDLDPVFFAHHLHGTYRKSSIGRDLINDQYWSMSCAAVTRKGKPDSYLTGSHSNSSLVKWCGHISIASVSTDKLDVLLLINGSDKHDSPKLEVPLLAEQALGLESPQLRDLLPNDLPYQHFDKILQFPPTKILLLEILRFSNAEHDSVKTRAMETLMTLVTWQRNLDTMADLTRDLEYEATDSPSKKVLRSLNKCRSMVLRLRDEVAQLNLMVKNEADISHDILGRALIAASPDFAWIPKSTIVLEKKDMRKSHGGERKIGKERCVRPVPDTEDAVDRKLEAKSPKIDREHSTSVIVRLLHRLDQKAERLSRELRESFLTLTTAISIEDAEFNKKQAERSTMLTLLAAIYLPLTLASGIFGMNIQEINGGSPRWWTVVVVTIVLLIPSAAFIFLLFGGDFTSIARKIKR